MRILTLVLVLVGISSKAFAGILIEPYAGYSMAKSNVTGIDPITGEEYGDNNKMNGVGYGLRLGWTAPLLFWLAGDFLQRKGTVEHDDKRASDTGVHTAYGLTAGIDLPIFLRAWAGYNFKDSLELTGGTPSTTDTLTGNSTKFGIGLTFLPFLSLNFEYITSKYNEASGSSFTTAKFSDAFKKYEAHTYLVSLSLPIDL